MEEIISLNYWSEQFYYNYNDELLAGRDIKETAHEYAQELQIPNKEVCEWLSDYPDVVDEYYQKFDFKGSLSLIEKLHKLYRIYVEDMIEVDNIKLLLEELLETDKNDK